MSTSNLPCKCNVYSGLDPQLPPLDDIKRVRARAKRDVRAVRPLAFDVIPVLQLDLLDRVHLERA